MEETIISELIIGVVSGVIASIIVLVVTSISEYSLRKKIEKYKTYELEYVGERDAGTSPEYPRETAYIELSHEKNVAEEFYNTVDIVKLQFPFDIKEIKIFEEGQMVYPTDNIGYLPEGDSIYVNCRLSVEDDIPAFIVKCRTFRHEYREYEYTIVHKYSGGMSGFRLKMTKQRFSL